MITTTKTRGRAVQQSGGDFNSEFDAMYQVALSLARSLRLDFKRLDSDSSRPQIAEFILVEMGAMLSSTRPLVEQPDPQVDVLLTQVEKLKRENQALQEQLESSLKDYNRQCDNTNSMVNQKLALRQQIDLYQQELWSTTEALINKATKKAKEYRYVRDRAECQGRVLALRALKRWMKTKWL